jgi:hypothetical protein
MVFDTKICNCCPETPVCGQQALKNSEVRSIARDLQALSEVSRQAAANIGFALPDKSNGFLGGAYYE